MSEYEKKINPRRNATTHDPEHIADTSIPAEGRYHKPPKEKPSDPEKLSPDIKPKPKGSQGEVILYKGELVYRVSPSHIGGEAAYVKRASGYRKRGSTKKGQSLKAVKRKKLG